MPFQTQTKGNRRGKSDPRMSLVKWARENGAVHIKIDGIELVFPPSFAQGEPATALSPEDVVRKATKTPEFNANAPNAVVSEHPDEYADNSDRWAHFSPYAVQG